MSLLLSLRLAETGGRGLPAGSLYSHPQPSLFIKHLAGSLPRVTKNDFERSKARIQGSKIPKLHMDPCLVAQQPSWLWLCSQMETRWSDLHISDSGPGSPQTRCITL